MPVNAAYRPDPRHQGLGPEFFDRVAPARFPRADLRFRNDRWAARIGLDNLTDAEWVAHFAQFEPLPGNLQAPLALRYHGHQFQSYNPNIGDGRGFLFAQARDAQDNRLLDLATKGSGTTPWSRSGDGRLTLKGGIREVLATEMLEALGCYTSKSFSLIETGEALQRNDEPSPTRSAVLVRLGHSHVRIGTFQRFAHQGDLESLRALTDYAITTYWPNAAAAADPVAAFLKSTAGAVAMMAAEWFVAGFVHGVLNTDNTVITGESFDYGPWRFLPYADAGFTAAYFDESGLYAFGRQAGAISWNLQRLAECLLPLSTEAHLVEALEGYGPAFESALVRGTMARLGLATDKQGDMDALARPFYAAMSRSRCGFERAFFDLVGGALPERMLASPHAEVYETDVWQPVIAKLREMPKSAAAQETLAHPYFERQAPVTMLIEDMEGIWAPIAAADDWSAFYSMIADIRSMGAAHAPLLTSRR